MLRLESDGRLLIRIHTATSDAAPIERAGEWTNEKAFAATAVLFRKSLR